MAAKNALCRKFNFVPKIDVIVSFADNALESVVREAIARPLGFIFLDAIGDLTALHAAAGITDISGIEHLHNLQTSTCRAMRSSILHHSRTFTD